MTYDYRQKKEFLTPSVKHEGYFECPVCDGHKLGIDAKTGKTQCWSGHCDMNDIRKAIDVLEGKGGTYRPNKELAEKKEQQRRAEEEYKLSKLDSREDRHRSLMYKSMNHQLIDIDRKDLEARGLAPEQIKEIGTFSTNRGYAVPVRDLNGLMVGAQVRSRDPQETNRYKWLGASGTNHIPPSGELPLAHWFGEGEVNKIYLVEGTGVKPYLAAKRLGGLVLGASGANFASSANELKRAIDAYPLADVVLVPDGGAISNTQTMGAYEKANDLLKSWNKELSALWWDQTSKESGDIDEIGTDTALRVIKWESLPCASTSEKQAKNDDENEEKNPSPLAVSKLLAADLFDEKIRFDASTKQYWRYDGRGKWLVCSDEYIFGAVQDYLEEICPKDFSTSYVTNAIKFALKNFLHEGWTEASSLQYLPFANGVLELASNKLLPHSPDYGFTWQLPRDYSILAADWANIGNFLKTLCVGNTELGEIAIAYCNAVLKGRADLQKFLYLFGSGANGKGAFMNLLTMLIGKENTHSTTMAELNEGRFESANLKNKRLVLMTDEDKRSGGFGIFKAATGQDRIRYERKNKDASNFVFTGMFVVAANSPTFVGESNYAIKRRKIDFPCTAKIAEGDRRDLTPEFEADLPAFTTFLLSLPDEWVTKTLRSVAKVEAVAKMAWEMAIREDSIAAFYDEFLEPDVNGLIKCGELYEKYETFCEKSGLRSKSIVNFTPSLVELCRDTFSFSVHKQHSMNGKILKGLKYKSTSANEEKQVSPRVEDWENFLAELEGLNPSYPSYLAQGNNSKPVIDPSLPVIPVINQEEIPIEDRKIASHEKTNMTGMTPYDGYMTGSKPLQGEAYDGYDGLEQYLQPGENSEGFLNEI
jgi:P4 family phage/plasmid primase-like protien